MSDDEFFHADFSRFFRQNQAFPRRTVSGSENNIRPGAQLHHPDHFRKDFALPIKHRDSRSGEFVAPVLVSRGKSRHPDTAAEPAGGFERLFRREHIDLVAVNTVHAETPEHLELRKCLTDQECPVMTAPVVRLVHDRPVARLFRLFRQREFVDAARTCVGQTVDMNVADPGKPRIACAVFPGVRRPDRRSAD